MEYAEQMLYGELPAVHLTAPDGAQAIVTLYGAHLVSWKGADGRERLFVSSQSAMDGSRAIRGGVPVIFPQFAARGGGMRHGFARVLDWQVAQNGHEGDWTFVVLTLTEEDLPPSTAATFPFPFKLVLRIAVRANELAMTLSVMNTGDKPFPFAAALHTYHLVDDLATVRIEGVEAQPLAIHDKLDKVYEGVAGAIVLASAAGTLRLEQGGFTDAVVWNPGAADAAALADLADDEYRRFVCIEPAALGPVTLAPKTVWRGEYRVTPG